MSEYTCVCGHAVEEHGHDPKYPGSTACTAEGCDCIALEAAEEWDAEDDRNIITGEKS